MSYDFTLTTLATGGPAAPLSPLPVDRIDPVLDRTPGMAQTGIGERTWLVAVGPLTDEEIRRRVETLENDNRLPDDMAPVDLVFEPRDPGSGAPTRLHLKVPYGTPPAAFPLVLDLLDEMAREAGLAVRDDQLGRVISSRDRKMIAASWESARNRGRRLLGTRFGYRPAAEVEEPVPTVPAANPAAATAPPLENRGAFPIGFLLLLAAIFALLLVLRWLVQGPR